MPAKKLLRLPQVIDRIGICKASVFRLVKLGQFPAPIRISDRAVAWVESDLDEWIDSRIRQSHTVAEQ